MSGDEGDDDESVTIGGSFRIARKPHVCMCGRTIFPGSRYERTVTKVDGSIEVSKVSTSHIHSFEADEAALDAYWDARIDDR